MPKRPKAPAHVSAWSWLCGWARAQGLDLDRISLAEAAERIVSQLEECRASGVPLPVDAVRLASRLVRWQGELLLSEASSADPMIERVCARERAQLLARQLERGPLIEPKPEIGEPDEPEKPETFTLYDLVRLCESLARDAEHLRSRRTMAPAQ